MDTKTLSPTTRSSPCASPEFEFWMVRNPSFPPPNILSADELIVNGVLLPLHLINKPDPSPPITLTDPSSSKRWKDIFKKSDKKNNNDAKKQLKEKKSGVTTSAELNININIWPFSRSRSAGNAATRPKLFAPCSRSNSAGESKSRKWPSSPARPGVHLGRSSPVWQVRPDNNKSKRESRRSKVVAGGSGSSNSKTKILNLNVPMCIGYRHHLTCRSDENSDNIPATARPRPPPHANVGGKLFTLRSLFTRKTLVTSH